jgi:putative DNA primase/helicase
LQVFWKGWICVPQKAGYAFLKRLASDVTEDEAKLKGRMNRFYKIADVDTSDGYQVRFAKRFALAYAAGLLAIDYSVVPWKRVLVKRCIRRCYKKASHRIAGPAESIETTAQKVLSEVQRTDVVDIRRTSPPIDPKTAEKSDVLLITHSDGSSLYAVRRDFFKSIVRKYISPRKMAEYLDHHGILYPGLTG